MKIHEKASERIMELEEMKRERQSRSHILKGFIRDMEGYTVVIDEFDERIWMVTVEKVEVIQDGDLTFCFNNGMEVQGS